MNQDEKIMNDTIEMEGLILRKTPIFLKIVGIVYPITALVLIYLAYQGFSVFEIAFSMLLILNVSIIVYSYLKKEKIKMIKDDIYINDVKIRMTAYKFNRFLLPGLYLKSMDQEEFLFIDFLGKKNFFYEKKETGIGIFIKKLENRYLYDNNFSISIFKILLWIQIAGLSIVFSMFYLIYNGVIK